MQTKVVTLASGNFTSITFTWNTTGFAKGNYTISAVADKIPGDVSSAMPSVPDYRVDARDITYLILLFDTRPGSQNWNSNADINDDGAVNARDITIAVLNFYEHE